MASLFGKEGHRTNKEKLFKDRPAEFPRHPDVGPWRPPSGTRPEGKTVTREVADLDDKKTSRLEKRIYKLKGRANKQSEKSWNKDPSGTSNNRHEKRYKRISDRIRKLKGKQKKKTITTTVYPK